jgi:hypothetical protein
MSSSKFSSWYGTCTVLVLKYRTTKTIQKTYHDFFLLGRGGSEFALTFRHIGQF